MNKIYRLDRVLTYVRSLNSPKAHLVSARCFGTKDDSGRDQSSMSPSESPLVEKEVQMETKDEAKASETEIKLGGFAQSYKKFSHIGEEKKPEIPQTFASLIRHSKFVDLGDPEGKLVIGKIYHVVDNDLYIDFGWKFPCVCRRPVKNGQYYVRDSKVRLRIKDLELSSKFLGATTDITLLEANCTLIGLISSPLQVAEQKTQRPKKRNIIPS
ncbi:28S ribosomal protein S28, mitochondrial [Harpegnathos saltator]|uniref:28S ribosomal protein S28, mitochondrial n=1 Tax=Harpegnathos saltator TaxID=610380 RepID=E2C6B5_HARSA|nr:28S ribosomal protein S28, mitochondrial [Harpegnathos saltator]EFN76514.1 28S ribosomal protein S28, mitochondrial [Harpegnathos saltator]